MKTSTKCIALSLIVFAFIPWVVFYWYTQTMEILYEEYPYQDSIDYIEASNNIEEIKNFTLKRLTSDQELEKHYIEVFKSFVSMLLTIAICNVVFIALIYWDIRKILPKNSADNKTE